MKKYSIGVIGLGMGSTILEVNRQDSIPLEVTGICDTDIKKMEELKLKYGIGFITTDYRQLENTAIISMSGLFTSWR